MLKRRGKMFCRVYPKFSSGQKIKSPPIKKARKLTSQFTAVKAGVDLLQNTTASAIIDQLMGGNYIHTNCMLLCLVIFAFCITFHYFITFIRVCRCWTTSSATSSSRAESSRYRKCASWEVKPPTTAPITKWCSSW